jgi:hypothetical protein
VDHQTKRVILLPCRDSITSEETENLINHHVIRPHGIPLEVLSDRGPQFISKHWFSYFERLGAKVLLSSAFHPQTDGLTERTNQQVEVYLRQVISYDQTDWAEHLDACEISINNAPLGSTGHSPYFHDMGRNPKFDLVALEAKGAGVVEGAVQKAERMRELWAEMAREYAVVQKRMKEQADKKRRDVEFAVGDRVWVDRRNMSTGRPSAKLDWKRVGPYSITERIGNVAYRVALPPHVKAHNVFHVSLLSPFRQDTFGGRQPPPPEPERIDGELEWEVEAILDSRKKPGRGDGCLWLVKWKGYGFEEASWEPWENVRNAEALVKAFHVTYPGNPAPKKLRQGPLGVGRMVKRKRGT